MKKLIYHIVRLALVMIPVVLTVAPAMAQLEVYQGDTLNLSIEPEPEGSTYKWDVYCDLSVNFAQVDGNCPDGTYYFLNDIDDEAAVKAIFNTAGEYIIKIEVWDPVSCTNNMEFLKLIVHEALPEAELALDPDEICVDEPSVLTVTLTGEPLWGFIIEAKDEDG